MAGFRNVAAYAAAEAAGRTHFCSLRKVPSQASVSGNWVDLSMAAGNPRPQYYASAPLEAATLDGFDGLFHGDAKSPASKHLTHMGLMTPTAALVGRYSLLDYLLYYPFIDGDSLDEQTLDNTVTLPRYADGDGVMVMAVASAPTTGGGVFTFNYTEQSGAPQTSPAISCNTTACGIATIATSEQAQHPERHLLGAQRRAARARARAPSVRHRHARDQHHGRDRGDAPQARRAAGA